MNEPIINPRKSLRVFLSHSLRDKSVIRELYRRLRNDGFSPWLDEEDLLPGQDWHYEIKKTLETTDVVLICLSKNSVEQSGFVHKEIGYALDVAEEQPEGTIFLIPVRLEDCEVPTRLRKWLSVDYFQTDGYEKITRALQARLDAGRLKAAESDDRHNSSPLVPSADLSTTLAKFGPPASGIHKSISVDQIPKSRISQQHASARGSTEHTNVVASWLFGSLFTFFVLGVFVWGPATLPDFKQKLLAFICALLAGFFAFFFTGTLAVKVSGVQSGREPVAIKAAGGLGAFVVALWWWSGSFAPVKNAETSTSPASLTFRVLIVDAENGKPISNAHVSADGTTAKLTDTLGGAEFTVAKSAGITIDISAEADGYIALRRSISIAVDKAEFRLPLQQKPKESPSQKRRFDGTWEIRVSGDIGNKSIKSGTFEFARQPNGALLITGNYDSNGMEVRCNGTGSTVGARIFIEYSAVNTMGGSWKGRGELSLNADTMVGRWQGKSGEYFSVEMRRLQ